MVVRSLRERSGNSRSLRERTTLGSPMPAVRSVPLAWKNLAHDRVRFALFAAGIGFAVVLMGVQLGIMNAMLDGNVAIIKRLNGDLILVNPNKAALLFREGVSRRRMQQAEAVPGV